MDAEDVKSLCGSKFPVSTSLSVPRLTSIGQEILYKLDLQELFECADARFGFGEPMPSQTLPIEGVRWAIEMTGENGALWTSVHGMAMASF
jgi:hypothetical protein